MRYLTLVLFLLMGCSKTAEIFATEKAPDYFIAQEDGSWLVKHGPGGNVAEHLVFRSVLEKEGTSVVIDGKCMSSCTLFYSLPNTCLTPEASLHFHQVTGLGSEAWENEMSRYYRGEILELYNSTWRHSDNLAGVTAKRAKVYDPAVNICPSK
jgi:hypothetical protein